MRGKTVASGANNPSVPEIGAARTFVTVRLYELTGLVLIVPATTGIVYVNQTGGHACYQCEQEGYLVPIGWQGEEQGACNALQAHSTGPK